MKWFGFIVFLFLAVPGTSFAGITYERLPAGNQISSSQITVNVNFDENFATQNGWIDDQYLCVDFYAYSNLNNIIIDLDQYSDPVPINFDTNLTFTLNNAVQGQYNAVTIGSSATALCNNPSINQFYYSLEYDNENTIFSVNLNSNNNQIWGSAGLFGTSTNLASIVSTGVTTTGIVLWPLLIFLGVAVAFALAIKTQDFIMATGKARRSNKK